MPPRIHLIPESSTPPAFGPLQHQAATILQGVSILCRLDLHCRQFVQSSHIAPHFDHTHLRHLAASACNNQQQNMEKSTACNMMHLLHGTHHPQHTISLKMNGLLQRMVVNVGYDFSFDDFHPWHSGHSRSLADHRYAK